MSRRKNDQQGATNEYKVRVLYGDKEIGLGIELDTGSAEGVSGTYVWPPLSSGEVPFCFYAKTRPDGRCTLVFAWPGLVQEPIVTENASWVSLPNGFEVYANSDVVVLSRYELGFNIQYARLSKVLQMLIFQYV